MIEDVVRDFLLTRAAVTAIVATHPTASGPCIRPDRLHERDRLPAIVITVDEEEYQNDLSGKGGLARATLTISCMADSRRVSRQLAEAVRVNGTNPGTGLAGYKGTVSGVGIHAQLNSAQTAYASLDEKSDEGWYATEAVYEVWYSETV